MLPGCVYRNCPADEPHHHTPARELELQRLDRTDQEFVCTICIASPKDGTQKDDRLTILMGTMVCVDHIPMLHHQIRTQKQRARLLNGR